MEVINLNLHFLFSWSICIIISWILLFIQNKIKYIVTKKTLALGNVGEKVPENWIWEAKMSLVVNKNCSSENEGFVLSLKFKTCALSATTESMSLRSLKESLRPCSTLKPSSSFNTLQNPTTTRKRKRKRKRTWDKDNKIRFTQIATVSVWSHWTDLWASSIVLAWRISHGAGVNPSYSLVMI